MHLSYQESQRVKDWALCLSDQNIIDRQLIHKIQGCSVELKPADIMTAMQWYEEIPDQLVDHSDQKIYNRLTRRRKQFHYGT